jgi:hypothetical protein
MTLREATVSISPLLRGRYGSETTARSSRSMTLPGAVALLWVAATGEA